MHHKVLLLKKGLLSESHHKIRNRTNILNEEISLFDPKLLKLLETENLDILIYNLFLRLLPNYQNTKTHEKFKIEKGHELLEETEIKLLQTYLKEIPIILLKGGSLKYRLDIDLYKRSTDIDLLIQRKNLETATALLIKNGYRRLPCVSNGEFPMVNDLGVFLDIHYDLTASSPFIHLSQIDIDEIFRQSEFIQWASLSIRVMDIQFNWIYLLLHFSINHQFNEFILLFEIVQFMSAHKNRLDWDWLVKYSLDHNLESIVFISFYIISKFNPDLINAEANETLVQNKRRRRLLKKFADRELLTDYLLMGKRNNLKTNDLPKLCADTWKKRKMFKNGNEVWLKKEFF